jgi:ribosomal protein S13
MEWAELKQIRGIGDAMSERLGRDYEIKTIAQLARLSDVEADEVQRRLQAAGRRLPNGEVARWRDQALQLLNERREVAGEPLATFVVEVWRPAAGSDSQPRFVVHHIESDETLETSEPKPTAVDVFRWMEDRVSSPAAPDEAESPAAAQPAEPEEPRGRLRITGLEVRQAGSQVVNGPTRRLPVTDAVALDAGSAFVFVGHVSLTDAAEPVTCRMRFRLWRIDSNEEVAFTWSGEIAGAPGTRTASIPSAPVTISAGAYRGMVTAAGNRQAAGQAFREVPLLVVS